jgi:hypothetical protein
MAITAWDREKFTNGWKYLRSGRVYMMMRDMGGHRP